MWSKTAVISKKINFTIKNEIDAEGLSRPKSIGILTVLRCISAPNLVILDSQGETLACGQAKQFEFYVRIDLEDQGQLTIGILTILRCIPCPNLVILT